MTEKIQIGLRVTPEMQILLQKEAEEQNRSVNNLIETIIREYFIKKEKSP